MLVDTKSVQIWTVLTSEVNVESAFDVLAEDERLRAASFLQQSHRLEWVASRFALRIILSQYLMCSPKEVSFVLGEYGKPSVFQKDKQLHFNLSHSAELTVIAVSTDFVLGVDIENLRNNRIDMDAIAEKCFSDRERQEIANIELPQRRTKQLQIWTRKEAYMKAMGKGLQIAPKSFEVKPVAENVSEVKSMERCRHCNVQWHVIDLCITDGYVGSLCLRAEATPRIQYLNFNDKVM